jgi:hypothetical protein
MSPRSQAARMPMTTGRHLFLGFLPKKPIGSTTGGQLP